MIGRITGGIATSLLFSVFEAWMVSEFYSRGFKEELLSGFNLTSNALDIFSWSTFLNGLVAIISGVIANSLVDIYGKTSAGYVSPFIAALFVLFIAFGVIATTWKENYGNSGGSSDANFTEAVKSIRGDVKILAVGCMQCFFESGMYTFVFMWSPALEAVKASNEVWIHVLISDTPIRNNIRKFYGQHHDRINRVPSRAFKRLCKRSHRAWSLCHQLFHVCDFRYVYPS
jgi:hypothetical protein